MARFPRSDMVGEGENKEGVVSQHVNCTSRFDGRPVNWGAGPSVQKVGPNALFGLEEVGWESPMHDGLASKDIPMPRKPKKVAW